MARGRRSTWHAEPLSRGFASDAAISTDSPSHAIGIYEGSSIVGTIHGIRYAFSTKIHEFRKRRVGTNNNPVFASEYGSRTGGKDISRVTVFCLSRK